MEGRITVSFVGSEVTGRRWLVYGGRGIRKTAAGGVELDVDRCRHPWESNAAAHNICAYCCIEVII